MGLCQSDHGMFWATMPGLRTQEATGGQSGSHHLTCPVRKRIQGPTDPWVGDMGTSAGHRVETGAWQWRGSRGTLTGTLLDTGGAKAVLPQRVDLHLVGGRVIEHEWWTRVLAGGFITEPAADLPWEGWCDCWTPRWAGPQPSVSRCSVRADV